MIATPAIRNLIREGKTHQIYSALQAGAKYGMQTMDSHLADLVKQGRSPTTRRSRSATTSRTSTGSAAGPERTD